MNYDLKNKKQFFVAKAQNRIASTSGVTLDNLRDGDVVLSPMDGKTLVYYSGAGGYDAYDTMQIVAKRDGVLQYSTPFKYNKVRSYTVKPYAADTQQVTYIGYNGSTGQIEGDANVVTATDYIINLRKRSAYLNTNDVYFAKKPAQYYSGDATSTTEKDVATGLYESLNYAFSGQIDGYVKPELIYSGAATILGSSRTLTVTKDSEIAVASGSGHNLVAGDYVRIGGAYITCTLSGDAIVPTIVYGGFGYTTGATITVSAGTATLAVNTVDSNGTITSLTIGGTNTGYSSAPNVTVAESGVKQAVYKVASVDGTTITFTTVYRGESGTRISAYEINDTTTGNYGIRLSTVPKIFTTGRFFYDLFAFDVWLGTAFVNTPITYATTTKKGLGVGNEVVEMEWQGEYGNRLGTGEYNMPPRNFMLNGNADSANTYDLLVLEVENDTDMFTTGKHTQYTQIVVAIYSGGTSTYTQGDCHQSTYTEGLAIGLDEWLTDKTGVDPNQDANLTA